MLPAKSFLLLQGPVGPFFKLLAKHLFEQHGASVHQITFNGGDHWFSNKNISTPYQGSAQAWPEYLANFITQHKITDIVVFGDCRYYHRMAKKVADELSLSFWALEEGYLRPAFITIELGGVNANSLLDVSNIDSVPAAETATTSNDELRLMRPFSSMARHAIVYYFFKRLYAGKFKEYAHHRPWQSREECFNWVRSGFRKLKYKAKEQRLQGKIAETLSGQYFVAPLQVSVDSQILFHSPYDSVEEFIGMVIESFSKYANKDDYLLFKHHPMDRGFNNYARYIEKLSYAFDVKGRILYCHDLNLPRLLKHAKGTITINSTVGISSLHHQKPTKVMGQAIYNIDGITSQKSLDDFWQAPCAPCHDKFINFRRTIREKNQIPGSFYQRPELVIKTVTDKILA